MKAFKSQELKKAVLDYYDTLLNNLTVPYEQIVIKTRYGDTTIISAGDSGNPPVILLHGSSMNSAMWIKDINELSKAYRVFAPDIPGEPGKSDEGQLPFDTADLADWLADVLNALSVSRAIIVGASLGAWLATKFAITNLNKVEKLVLLCPAGIGSQNHGFKDIAMSLLMQGEDGVDKLFCKINGDVPLPEEILNYQKLISASFNSRQEPIPTFSDVELRCLAMPCAVFVGCKDIMFHSDETAERVSRLLPNARVEMLADKGHSLSGLADSIMAFLEQQNDSKLN